MSAKIYFKLWIFSIGISVDEFRAEMIGNVNSSFANINPYCAMEVIALPALGGFLRYFFAFVASKFNVFQIQFRVVDFCVLRTAWIHNTMT